MARTEFKAGWERARRLYDPCELIVIWFIRGENDLVHDEKY